MMGRRCKYLLSGLMVVLAVLILTGKKVFPMVENIHWLGHDTFLVVSTTMGGKPLTIYTDPFRLKASGAADIILITHDHFDHCSPDDVKKVQKEGTAIVATPDCASKLTGEIRTVKPGDTLTVKGVKIEAVPAYNTNKKYHPRGKNWVGYIFTAGGRRTYIAGDTDRIPEMKEFRNIDVALLPVSGTYVMTAEEAVRAALDIRPGIAVPMHYGSIVGDERDAARFQAELEGKVKVVILREE